MDSERSVNKMSNKEKITTLNDLVVELGEYLDGILLSDCNPPVSFPEIYPAGRLLKEIRSYLGITQSEMAQKLGVSQSVISKREGDKELDPDFSFMYLQNLGIAQDIFESLRLAMTASESTSLNRLLFAFKKDKLKLFSKIPGYLLVVPSTNLPPVLGENRVTLLPKYDVVLKRIKQLSPENYYRLEDYINLLLVSQNKDLGDQIQKSPNN